MNKIVIYTKATCPFCIKAKSLFQSKNISFTEIDVGNDEKQRENLMLISGGRKTVPQIFINDLHIGGCDDLYKLEEQGNLTKILQIS